MILCNKLNPTAHIAVVFTEQDPFRSYCPTVPLEKNKRFHILWKNCPMHHFSDSSTDCARFVMESWWSSTIYPYIYITQSTIGGGILRGARCLIYPTAPPLAVTPPESPCRLPSHTE